MLLSLFIAIPLLGGLLAWLAGKWNPSAARVVAAVAASADLALAIGLWSRHAWAVDVVAPGGFLLEERLAWLPALGVEYHLGMDGLSLLMVVLTGGVGVLAVVVSWREIDTRVGWFHACLLWVLAGVNGVFLALDLFLFYVCWEVMLVPMYFLIGVWGHQGRIRAALKFFLFTQASGLLMLLAILGLFFVHGQQTGHYTFGYLELLGTELTPRLGMLLMLGFFAGFAVKLPVVPLHSWLPDAHGEAPTAGSVILAGLLLKTGAYGLIRFLVPLFPDAAGRFAPVAMVLAVAGILYGALLAFSQTDLKRMVAYTSVSHMGFVLLGVFAWNQLALQGVVLQMICHAVSTGALFVVAGMLLERLHTRDIGKMGGLWDSAPRLSGMALVFALASLGLPGLGNFVAEFLILFGSFQASVVLTSVAAAGVVFATVYSLWMIQRIFHGPPDPVRRMPDLGRRELAVLGALVVLIVWLGLHPQPVLDTSSAAVRQVQHNAVGGGGEP